MTASSQLRSAPARLALAYGTVVALTVSVLLGTVYLLTRNVLERDIKAIVAAEVEDLADDQRFGGIEQVVETLRRRTDSWGRSGAVFLLADSSLHSLAGNLSAWPSDVVPRNGADFEFQIEAVELGRAGKHPVEARSVHLPGDYWLLVGTDTSERERTLRRFGFATLWGVGLTTLLVGILGWWYSRRNAHRVREIARTCDSIVHHDLARRLSIDNSHDEFDLLSGTVNAMLDRIEGQATTLRATFNSIAHDLRTPLYRLRVRLEDSMLGSTTVDTRTLLAPALAELDQVQRTLTTLLQIAQAESGNSAATHEPVDLAQLARQLGELYAPGMQDKDLTLQVIAPGQVFISGQRQLLAQLITNLLENCLKYVSGGGTVWLTVHAERSQVVLEVADNGPGIAAADRDTALQPFVRLAGHQDATGSGLGLSLVAAIARLHNGVLTLHNHEPGLLVRCRFAAQDTSGERGERCAGRS
jgi:signal transduction histidine kinase